jgi:uncharacterized membrane protein/glutaredoxin
MFRRLQLALALTLAMLGTAFQTSPSVVHALLFYSPTCPHCHLVMTESLPPIMAHYQDQLQIVAIDTTTASGQELYQMAVQALAIPDDRRGVPTLVVGGTVLVGSYEIPAMLPDLIEAGLAQGGVDWPSIPGLVDSLPAEAITSSGSVSQAPGGWWARFSQDTSGNGLALLVLLGILGTLGWSLAQLRRRPKKSASAKRADGWRRWGIPLLALAGVGISIYLSYVETSGSSAICGPIGDCNAVQQSDYARLFGVLPVGILGVIGYVLIASVHFFRVDRTGQAADRAAMTLLALTLAGSAFSAYLTFVEAFVIGAACAWCLTSAALMTVLLGLATGAAGEALGRARRLSA